MSAPVYMALLHYPMRNRNGELVTTAVTNMDIHDISRSARTYGMKGYFILTPLEIQHELVGKIVGHWREPKQAVYHPDRFEALSLIRLVREFGEIKRAIAEECGEEPEVVLTDASPLPEAMSYADYRREIMDPARKRPTLLVFGTGWGISDAFYPEVHRILAPVYGPEGVGGYNHLSVRSAVAIILDRLLGQ